ncbi:MAG: hypothetical protein JNK22_15290 [Rhodocyclaceae bacterium]|nr:hypothetical protein [Rhodocyclaceae bacterium]
MNVTDGGEQGVRFVPGPDGRRSSLGAGRAILAAALEAADPGAARALREEPAWRTAYPRHIRALVRAGLEDADAATRMASAGLRAASDRLEFMRAGSVLPLAAAIEKPAAMPDTLAIRGRGDARPAPWRLPWGGRHLEGTELADRIDAWEAAGIVEPGHAAALRRVAAHPEWLDLSDRHVVMLGAAAEAGPLAWLARWRANIVAVEPRRAEVWKRMAATVEAGNGRLLAPLLPGARDLGQAGADLLSDTPEVAAWAAAFPEPLAVLALAYLDGERHVRVVAAMNAVIDQVVRVRPDACPAFLATSTDAFAVPEPVAARARQGHADRDGARRLGQGLLRALSAGRLFAPHYAGPADGPRAIADCLVIQQGPNYALAKRMQQWQALGLRAAGRRVSFNVTPSTTTRSVVKNPALAAAFRGAGAFGIEVFRPETTNAITAALLVHDLRSEHAVGNPARPLDHPLDLLAAQAGHGGLWRLPYLPRSVLPLAAALGFLRR